jgi:hypothetical protein
MKRRTLVLAIAAATIGLSGCAQMPSGVVHDKQYTPGHLLPIGKTLIWYPDSWELDLYQSNSQHGWRDVDQSEYNKCSIGESYPACAR